MQPNVALSQLIDQYLVPCPDCHIPVSHGSLSRHKEDSCDRLIGRKLSGPKPIVARSSTRILKVNDGCEINCNATKTERDEILSSLSATEYELFII